MILKQYYLGCLAHASYLIADERTGVAAIVDPQRDVQQYLDDARKLGLRIKHVFLTHFHADFLAGHLELREAGARIYLGARGRADFEFTPVKDGDALEFGDVRLSILETPGHTPESISIAVTDLAKNPAAPRAVLTGDALFIGDVGRPDLLASVGVTAAELAGMLYDSLHGKLLKLPDETLVYPAHGAGSMCGKNLSEDTVSTIGAQRRGNYALQIRSRDEFIRTITEGQPEAPAYFAYDADLNKRERTTLDRTLEKSLRPLSLDHLLRLENAGAQIVDVREADAFAEAHLVGSINIQLSGKFATWCGTLLDRSKPIVVVGDSGREVEAVTRLARIGYDNVAGFLRDGVKALVGRPELAANFERVGPGTFAGVGAAGALVVDVRTTVEFKTKHIPGAGHMPLHRLEKLLDLLPRDRPIALYCRTGQRSATAASLLLKHGFHDVTDLRGGIVEWEAAGLATESSTPTEEMTR